MQLTHPDFLVLDGSGRGTGSKSLAKIAEGMRVDVDSAQRVLHRFLCLEIFDYWPASLLQAA